MFPAIDTLEIAFGVLIFGALLTVLMRRVSWTIAGSFATLIAAVSTLACWSLAWQVFMHGKIEIGSKLLAIPELASTLHFQIDSLSAVFLVLMPLVSLFSTYYSIGYMRKQYAQESPARYYPHALILLASIIGVVTTEDIVWFFIFWEFMTLSSFFLILFDRHHREKIYAGVKYFVVMHIAAVFTVTARIITAKYAGSYAFSEIAGGAKMMTPWTLHLVTALFFVGYATKAGVFPFSGWLPDAHAAAPSPVSALLSGSIVKLGIYGIVRTFLVFLPATGFAFFWGTLIATVGALSIFVGTISALRQDDCKRVLGFHTIGQVGYMLLGVGIGLAFINTNPMLAAVGLIGGLFHLVNHTTYKSLLFLNVGSAEYWTGTRDMNKMGGLGAFMPYTLAATVVASLSIAGVPPFSGFASKWLLYQASFRSGQSMPLYFLLFLIGTFISTVTLASFMKLLGSIFLGKLATNGQDIKGEVPFSMAAPQQVLSAICILFGVVPILPLMFLYKAAGSTFAYQHMPNFAALFGTSSTSLALSFGGHTVGFWNPAASAAAIVLCVLLSYAVFKAGGAPTRDVESWYCGEEFSPELVRFRSHGFVLPFKQALNWMYPTQAAKKKDRSTVPDQEVNK